MYRYREILAVRSLVKSLRCWTRRTPDKRAETINEGCKNNIFHSSSNVILVNRTLSVDRVNTLESRFWIRQYYSINNVKIDLKKHMLFPLLFSNWTKNRKTTSVNRESVEAK